MSYFFSEIITVVKYRLRVLISSDFQNNLSCRKIWINPNHIQYKLMGDPWLSAKDWRTQVDWVADGRYQKYTNTFKYKACIQHWKYGTSWDEVGMYEYISKIHASRFNRCSKENIRYLDTDGCQTMDDIKLRYQYLDRIFEMVKTEGRFRIFKSTNTHFPLQKKKYYDDIVVHIGPNGEIYHGHNGNHRVAMALLLDLPLRVTVGSVHISAYPCLKYYIRDSYIYAIEDFVKLLKNIVLRKQ